MMEDKELVHSVLHLIVIQKYGNITRTFTTSTQDLQENDPILVLRHQRLQYLYILTELTTKMERRKG